MTRNVLLSILVIGGCVSGTALASPITFNFTGTVTETNFDPGDPFGGAVSFGAPVTGNYTFDGTALDLIAASNQGSFQTSGYPFGLRVSVGGRVFQIQDFLAINVVDSGVAEYGVLACSGDASCSGDLNFSLLLNDSSGSAITSDQLPLTPPPIDRFDNAIFTLMGVDQGNQFEIAGNVSALTATPETNTNVLISIGLLAVSLVRLFGVHGAKGRRRY